MSVQCSDTDGIGNEDVYRLSFDGGVTPAGQIRSEAWPTSGGVVYDANGGEAAAKWVLRTDSGARELPLNGSSDLVGSTGDRAFVVSSPSDPAAGSTLFTYDVRTGQRVTLAAAPRTPKSHVCTRIHA